MPEAKLHKMDTFGALQQTHATNTRGQLRACTNETKRNDFGIGLTPHPPIYIYIYILHVYTQQSFGSSFGGREGCGEEKVEKLFNNDRDSLTRLATIIRFGRFTFHVVRWI